MATAPHPSHARLTGLLPDAIAGWRAEGVGEVYDRDGLFDLINGGAEVYRELNVVAVLDRGYRKAGAADLIVDLFDMGSPADAYGAYHADMREEPGVGVGVESEYQGGTLYFWKGRYFASLVALQETAETRAALIALGRHLDRAIDEPSPVPALAQRLPGEALDRSQLYFFHSHRSLARHYPLADDNLLGLSAQTEAVLARYPERAADAPATLVLLVQYPTTAAAVAALEQLRTRRLGGATGVRATTTGRFEGAGQQGAVLAAVFEAPTAARATQLLSRLLPAPVKEPSR